MTPEQAQARCGNITASMFSAVLAKGEGKTRAKYLRQVVAERLTGKPCETYRNAHMDRGNEQEPFARIEYELRTGEPVIESDFIPHPTLRAGCSPDGLIGKDGGGEFKSVIATVQIETLMCRTYPTEHKAQVQGSLWITEREWWDFASFCPDMLNERHRLYIFRVYRDEAYIANLEAEVSRACEEVDRMCDLLNGVDRTEELLRASIAKVAA